MDVFAHGVGGGSDLPIPASYAVLGGTAALTVTFAVLLMAWRAPRYGDGEGGRAAPGWIAGVVDSRAFLPIARAFGVAVLAFGIWCVAAGQDLATNPVFGLVYVLLWVGLVPASLLFGSFIRTVSPVRGVHAVIARALPVERRSGFVTLPDGVGQWPAALGLLAFTWIELVSPDGVTLGVVGTWFGTYVVLMVAGGMVFGPDWFARADPFEAYSTLVGHLSVWSRDSRGALQVVSPLRNLARVQVRPGLVAVVGVLLGSTAFDSLRDSTPWVRFRQQTDLDVTLVETGLLVLVCAVVIGLFYAACTAPEPKPGKGAPTRRELPGRLAHSVVPIVVGYMVAHYLTLFVETGQLTLIQASDPLGTGANLFGTADLQVDIWLSQHPTLLATVKVAAIVLGHIVGVVAAHDRAIGLLPTRSHSTGQLPLLVVMVVYTFGGLFLLFGL